MTQNNASIHQAHDILCGARFADILTKMPDIEKKALEARIGLHITKNELFIPLDNGKVGPGFLPSHRPLLVFYH